MEISSNNVPILAYSEDVRSASEAQIQKFTQNAQAIDEDAYVLPLDGQNQNMKLSRQSDQSPINSANDIEQIRISPNFSNRNLKGNNINGQNDEITQSKSELVPNPSQRSNFKHADKVFEPKPPSSLAAANIINPNVNMQHAQQQPIQNMIQFNVRVNSNPVNQGGLIGESTDMTAATKQLAHQIMTPQQTKNRSRDRRPLSSKQNDQKYIQSVQSSTIPMAQLHQNPYFVHVPRSGCKKRPQSANRKNLIYVNGQMKTGLKPELGKSHATSSSNKKQSIVQFNQHFGTNATQKHRRLVYKQQQLESQYNGHFVSSKYDNHNQPNPYQKTIKMVTQFGVPVPTKNIQVSKMQHQGFVFTQPDKMPTKMKSKIPKATLQSREDLYEQNMHTKVQINSLMSENRKINTKLQVLENQLLQKDRMFEDMYRAAFSQNSKLNLNSSNLVHVFHPMQLSQQSSHVNQMSKESQILSNSLGMSSHTNLQSQQQHHQAQQLINTYKRTIRDQSREIERRNFEIDQMKRSVKVTQINQLMIEIETY